VSKDDDIRDSNYWHAQAEEARARADHLDDVVAKAQMIDRADKYDLMAERAVGRPRIHGELLKLGIEIAQSNEDP
jgi:hypothetical protein